MAKSCPVIEGGYLRDILAQPQALEDTIIGLEEPAGLTSLAQRKILLTGMGSSYHAFQSILVDLAEKGLAASLVETSELIHYQNRRLDAGTVTIALSQSGRSAEITRLIEINQDRSPIIGITNDPDSPLAHAARICILTHAGSEFSVSTKTYVSSLAALAWLADRLCGRDSRDLTQLPRAMSLYLERWRGHVAEAQSVLDGVEHMFLAGRGASLATTGTGGLITKEAARFPAEGMSAAAFRHGPLEMVSPGMLLLVFEGDPRTAELNARLVHDVRSEGGRAELVRESAEPGLFRTPHVPARLRPIVEILPVQMLTLALAARAGREAGAFERTTKITLSE